MSPPDQSFGSGSSTSNWGELRILVVDDDPTVAKVVGRMLEGEAEAQILSVTDATEVEVVAEKFGPNVILLDYELPGISAIEVIRGLVWSAELSRVPIVVLSSHSDEDIKVRCLSRGAADYLVKFPSRGEFIARLKLQAANFRRGEAGWRELQRLRDEAHVERSSDELFAGRYRVGETLGKGSFATVYRAYHEGLDADVALKVLRAELLGKRAVRDYFRNEGPAAFRVHHPNAVQVFDAGVSGSGRPFLAMELVEGETLKSRIKRLGRPPLPLLLSWLASVSDALVAAHAVGVIHRDMKPSNLMLTRPDTAMGIKVVDFGLSQLMADRPTSQSFVAGTPAYLSPERVRRTEETGMSDVYSFGVVAYEALSGRKPLGKASDTPVEVAQRHVRDQPEPLSIHAPNVPEPVLRAVMLALSKSPDDRPTAAEMAAVLHEHA